ncbi:2,5-diketo-D-gluconate reductase A [Actinobaculum suis]|uniref:2,5-diketo-D-gluconate reductase A n=1 Tax=Actinobaculum suis TaxID=1657 RepID=A0A0K9ESP1_9ACTO|nr:aldo/keto reductase [Actinobaculum suis]KMY23204.1 oxidoreductase [Actinobaculum suis]MDY5152655.1 aldo/keto reductase [Actinobaculum suis]SDE10930.1 2,5-diketo-D-gluconate reductase A [Actinobaculum suis]VDG75407.1 2,5-diketo-D-gluconic acid reductase A [Actinobaculum suis]
MSTIPVFPLNSGTTIPAFGLGTYKMDDTTAEFAVNEALQMGYRHIDTAQMYHNEEAVGRGIKKSGIAREDIFLTTKLDNMNHAPADVRRTFEESLRKLQTDYVDLFLIHWPMLTGDYIDTWKTFEELQASGRAKAIGVSNFEIHHLQALRNNTETVPAVNQIELHPYFQNTEVAQYCADAGIRVQAWAPIAKGKVVDDLLLQNLAARKGCTPVQLVLAWHLANYRIIFPKASSVAHLEENLRALDVKLLQEDVTEINDLDQFEDGRTGMHPDTMKRRGE